VIDPIVEIGQYGATLADVALGAGGRRRHLRGARADAAAAGGAGAGAGGGVTLTGRLALRLVALIVACAVAWAGAQAAPSPREPGGLALVEAHEVAGSRIELWAPPAGTFGMAQVRVIAPAGEPLVVEDAVLRLVRVGGDEAWRPDAFRFEVGDDLTGDGRPNVLIEGYSMGAHCCFSYVLVALGEEAEVVWSASTADASLDLVDLDGDGVPEALTHDMGYAYDLCSFAESPAPIVVLAWRDGTYRVANRAFPRAYDAAIVGALQQALAGEPPASVGGSAGPPRDPVPAVEGWLPGACDVAHLVLNLLYAGHDEAAWRALARFYAGDAAVLTCRLWSVASSSPWYQGAEGR
jgi:hypothetical protein